MIGSEIIVAGATKVAEWVAKQAGSMALEKCRNYRALKFWEAFVSTVAEELEEGVESEKTNEALNKILADPSKSEVVWLAYRSVCLSKSKEFGPQIIGFLTARIRIEGRVAMEDEEAIFGAAEYFSDRALIEFCKIYDKYAHEADSENPDVQRQEDGSIAILDGARPALQKFGNAGFQDPFSLTVAEFLYPHSWRFDAERFGLVVIRLMERKMGSSGTKILNGRATFTGTAKRLCELLKRVFGPDNTAIPDF